MRNLLHYKIITPLIISMFIMLSGIFFLTPYLLKEFSKEDAFMQAKQVVENIKVFRSYYSRDILSKIQEHSTLKADYNHKTKPQTLPLPITLIHDIGSEFTKNTNISIKVYSHHPFPNRASRKLDQFEQESLSYLIKNPKKSYVREDIINDKPVLRTAFADILSESACVKCHNTRVDTPKDDWKLGDVRGAIEIIVPLAHTYNEMQKITYAIIIFISFNFFLLALYFIKNRSTNSSLQKLFTNKDKILSEYKKAVDAGAIVSKADKNGIITYANEAFVEVSGYSLEELIGKSHSIVRHPDTDKKVFEQMWKKLKNKEIWQGDIKNLAKNKTSYYVYATIVPIVDENENIVEFLALRYNTTKLHEAILKANEAEKTKSRFLANMSHELRTPLNAIIGFSQILQKKESLGKKELLYVEKIALSGQNLLTLVNSILDFSKIEEGEMEFHPTQISINELFAEIMVLFETSISEKKINLQITMSKGEKLYADRQLLKQALINIISNAVKFTPQNGKIEISCKKDADNYKFTLCDSGSGISKEDIKILFDPFKQGENAHKEVITGTGLGLAITHKIVTQLHNGKIWVESELGEGTCFHISL